MGAFLLSGVLLCTPSTFANEVVTVRAVTDGDTVRLTDGRKVRLIGINAPELARDRRREEPLARLARQELTRLIGRRAITLVIGPDAHDRYGRLLAHIKLANGKWAGERLLQQGLASVIAIPPNLAHLPHYRKAEASARRNKIGIWAHPDYRPIPATSLSSDKTGYQFVAGRIKRVGRSRKNIYFNLTPSFAVVIKRKHWHYFGGDPQQWRGKRIIVRGWVSWRNNELKIRVGHPAMIEILE